MHIVIQRVCKFLSQITEFMPEGYSPSVLLSSSGSEGVLFNKKCLASQWDNNSQMASKFNEIKEIRRCKQVSKSKYPLQNQYRFPPHHPHAPRNIQWLLVRARANCRTTSRLKESATGPACPRLSDTSLSFVNPDLIYPCNTGFITSLAGTCIWLD